MLKKTKLAVTLKTACDKLRQCYAWRRLLHELLAGGNVVNAHRPSLQVPAWGGVGGGLTGLPTELC